MQKFFFIRKNLLFLGLLLFSLTAVTLAFCLQAGDKNFLSLATSLAGVVCILLVAKGLIVGQWATLLYIALYAALSWQSRYYGEFGICLLIMLPATLLALYTWNKHRGQDNRTVRPRKISAKEFWLLLFIALSCAVAAYFLLSTIGTAEPLPSALSITTSLAATYLLIRRNELYALFYIANDVILIILWALAYAAGQNVLPSIICYCVFLLNDAYAFCVWHGRAKKQN